MAPSLTDYPYTKTNILRPKQASTRPNNRSTERMMGAKLNHVPYIANPPSNSAKVTMVADPLASRNSDTGTSRRTYEADKQLA